MVLRDLDSYMQKNKTRPPNYTIHQNKLKMDKVSHDTMKVLEENIGRKISDIPCSNVFADLSPRARDIKVRINKKASAWLKKTSAKSKGNQPYGKTYLLMIPQIRI